MSECTIDNDFLCKHSMFGGLVEDELLLIKKFLTEREVPAHTTLLKQGEPNRSFHVSVACQREQHHASSPPCRAALFWPDGNHEIQSWHLSNHHHATKIITPQHDSTRYRGLKTYTMLILNLARDISRRLRSADEMLALAKNKTTMPSSPHPDGASSSGI